MYNGLLNISTLSFLTASIALIVLFWQFFQPLISARFNHFSPIRFATMSSQSAPKHAAPHPAYELLYHPSIPGRGEFIRLLFEASRTAYTELARDHASGFDQVRDLCMDSTRALSSSGNPPLYAPPALRVRGADDGIEDDLVIHQTFNIMLYLAPKVGLEPVGKRAVLYARQLALTALDLNTEIRDTHHPVRKMGYYEEQKEAALETAKEMRELRLPKFFSYFTRALEFNWRKGGEGRYLVGKRLTFADSTVWQVIDGTYFAFPEEMKVRRKEFPELLEGFYEGFKGEAGVKEYLASERRMPYSNGVFRYYPELDRQT